MIRLLAGTAVRVGELVALTLDDVNLDERQIVIHGKGNRERLAFVVDTPTASVLRRYLSERLAAPCHNHALFVNLALNPLTTEGVRRSLRVLGTKAEISTKITPHMLRHTAATTLLENGADLRIVQEFLGHDSIRSTERYTHVSRSHLRRVLERRHPLRAVA